MIIGELYLVKGVCLLFPTKERGLVRIPWRCGLPAAYRHAKELSQDFKCNVSVVEPNTYVVLLEMDEIYFKVLDSNGNIGWIYCSDFSGYFELVKANQ